MGVVVSATKMEIGQTWNPEPSGEINAGDVIIRTISRNAEGTSAMMLPGVSTGAPQGVQVYTGAGEVQDVVQRGDSRAQRSDII